MSLSDVTVLSTDEVLAELRSIMVSELGLAPETIEPARDLIVDLDLDSIDLVDLAVSLEERSGIMLEEEELERVRTVGDAVDVIHAACRRRGPGTA